MSDQYALSDLERRVANMIRIGKVTEVDLDAQRAKVDTGDGDPTDWIPWAVGKAGKNRRWQAPDVGEQVVVFSPSGEFGLGVIWGAIFQDDFPANGNEQTVERSTFEDGSIIEYDRAGHALNLTLHTDTVLTITIGGMTVQVTKDLAKVGASAINFVAMSNLVKARLDALATAINGWTPTPNDGGAALKIALTSWLAAPNDVAATNLKAQ